MALIMSRERTGVRFLWADGEVESTVALLPEDDEETLVRKLKRIIALVEGVQPSVRPAISGWTGEVQGPQVSGGDILPSAQPTLGWTKALTEPPPVPEGADYELIPPEELA